MRESKELFIPLKQIFNLLPTPISCYAYGGSIITIPPTPTTSRKTNAYYIVEEGNTLDLPTHSVISALPPVMGRGEKIIRPLKLRGMRVYPMEDA